LAIPMTDLTETYQSYCKWEDNL